MAELEITDVFCTGVALDQAISVSVQELRAAIPGIDIFVVEDACVVANQADLPVRLRCCCSRVRARDGLASVLTVVCKAHFRTSPTPRCRLPRSNLR